MSDRRAAIVGVGNMLMGDDGVGPAVVEALQQRGVGDRVELIDAGLAFSEVLCDLDAGSPLWIVDAIRGDGEPGSIYRLQLDDLADECGAMGSALSLHEVSVLPALRMEALAGRPFTDVTLFGVEPGQVAWGEGLSPPVAEAVEKLVQVLCRYLDRREADPSAGEAHAASGSNKR